MINRLSWNALSKEDQEEFRSWPCFRPTLIASLPTDDYMRRMTYQIVDATGKRKLSARNDGLLADVFSI